MFTHVSELIAVNCVYLTEAFANFAQNMKKDALFFRETRDSDGARIGWRLTKAGIQEVKARVGDLLVLAGASNAPRACVAPSPPPMAPLRQHQPSLAS